jgi:pimeloyl-ACP methyl ester carboxylesterase
MAPIKKTFILFLSLTLVTFFSKLVAEPRHVEKSGHLQPAPPPAGFQSKYALVNGVKIHYVVGGTGAPLLLIHGFGQNWYMWNRLLPELSKHFTVIAPDLRGVGESAKPADGYDKKTLAIDLHELMKQLGFTKADVAGHDVGLMVAYAYAAQFPNDVEKVALLDALLAGIEPVWSQVKAQAWWFAFFSQPHAGQLVTGRFDILFEDFWPEVSFVQNSFTNAEKAEFIRAYSVAGAPSATFRWFATLSQDAIDNQEFRKTKLAMPVLAMGSDHFAPFLAEHCRLVASDVKECIITGSGHWIVQEQTAQVQKGLLDFFLNN